MDHLCALSLAASSTARRSTDSGGLAAGVTPHSAHSLAPTHRACIPPQTELSVPNSDSSLVGTNLSACVFQFGDRGGSLPSHTLGGQRPQKLFREERVAIMDRVVLAIEDPVDRIGETPTDRAHLQPTCRGRDASDLDLASYFSMNPESPA